MSHSCSNKSRKKNLNNPSMPFECSFTQARMFRGAIEAIKDCCSDESHGVNLRCTPGGIAIQSINTGKSILTSIEFNELAFSYYHCDNPLTLGLNVNSLCKIFKTSDYNDELMLGVNSNDVDSLMIRFNNSDKSRSLQFRLSLLDVKQDHLDVPETEYSVVININTNELSRIFRDFSGKNGFEIQTVQLQVFQSSVRFCVKSDFMDAIVSISSNDKKNKNEKNENNHNNNNNNNHNNKEEDQNNETSGDDIGNGLHKIKKNSKKTEIKEAFKCSILQFPKYRENPIVTKTEDGTGEISNEMSSSDNNVNNNGDSEDELLLMNSTFGFQQLYKCCSHRTLSPLVNIKMDLGTPILIEYNLEINNVLVGFVRFYLCPKIEADEENNEEGEN